MDLSQHATGVPGGFLDALPYFLLVGLVIATGFLQARQSKRNAPNMNSQMAMVTQILPIGFGLFSLQFPAGLVLYYFVSNLWRLGQQEVIMRKITRPGREQIAAPTGKGRAIDVKGADKGERRDRRHRPEGKKPGGLRKLFQPRRPPAERRHVGHGAGQDGRARRLEADARRGAARRRARRAHPAASDGRTTSASESARRPEDRAHATHGCRGSAKRGRSARRRSTTKAETTMEWVETTGRSVEEALDAALDELGVDEDDVEYEVLEQAKSGLFGRLGGNPARIRARVKPMSREKPGERQRRNRRSGSRVGQRFRRHAAGDAGGATSADRGGAAATSAQLRRGGRWRTAGWRSERRLAPAPPRRRGRSGGPRRSPDAAERREPNGVQATRDWRGRRPTARDERSRRAAREGNCDGDHRPGAFRSRSRRDIAEGFTTGGWSTRSTSGRP